MIMYVSELCKLKCKMKAECDVEVNDVDVLLGYSMLPQQHTTLERLRFAFTAINVNSKNCYVIMIFPPFFMSAVCRFQLVSIN